jgi:predicted flap endonuclease-1-like 5' DNA nuclease
LKGDTTKAFREKKTNTHNFAGVLHQQGKVLIDSDFNDRTYITTNWQDQAGRDIIGAGVAAVPEMEFQNFKIQEETISIDKEAEEISFDITCGRLWADGFLLYLENQKLEKQKRIALKHPLFMHNENSSRYAILLEVWRDTINGFQLPRDLIEPALGGIDTTQRLHTAFAFRSLRLPSKSHDTCVDIRNLINDILDAKKGRLTVAFESIGGDNQSTIKECSGYTGLENRNYRIEVAEVNEGPPHNMVKWSKCNGGLVGRGNKDGNTIKITANLQAILSSGSKKFYLEIIQHNEKYGFWGPVFGATVELTPENDLDVKGTPYLTREASNGNIFFRLWDGIFPVSDSLTSLEDGICLEFDIINWGNMRPGDYWTFPVRAKSKIPVVSDQLPKAKEPDGINYHLIPLAIISKNKDGILEFTDCRVPFRSLVNQKDCRTFMLGENGDFTKILDALEILSKHTRAFMEQMVKECEVEKKRFEKETLQRLRAEVQERIRYKRLQIEEEMREKIEAERKKGMLKVEEISGIGTKSAEKLKKKGIVDVEDFYKTPAGKLARILGISESRVREMKENNVSLLEEAPSKQEKE